MIKPVHLYIFVVTAGVLLAGCSSDTPQATAQQKKDFAGGPMPPDAQKKFQESMQRAHAGAAQKAQAGGNQ